MDEHGSPTLMENNIGVSPLQGIPNIHSKRNKWALQSEILPTQTKDRVI